jgi:hypothetical protein
MSWFTRKSRPARVTKDRYADKPLLIVLENYVLSTVAPLSPEKERETLDILQRLYGGRSDWRSMLRTRFQIPDSMDEHVRQMWVTDQERAERDGITPTIEDFARMIVDQNFAHLIEEK